MKKVYNMDLEKLPARLKMVQRWEQLCLVDIYIAIRK